MSNLSTSNRSSQLPTALIGLAFLVVAAVFVSTTDWFTFFLTVHVDLRRDLDRRRHVADDPRDQAERQDDGEALVAIARQAAFVGERIFAPSGIVVVVMGVAMIENGGLGYNHFWVVFGLLGFLSTFVTGVGVLAPMSKKVAAIVEAHGAHSPESRPRSRRSC